VNRLAVRFTLSHLLVALAGGLVTFGLVFWLAPAMFEEQLGLGPGGPGPGQGAGGGGPAYGQALRASFRAAVTNALLTGTLAGAALAAILGVLAARQLLRPLGRVGTAVGRLARGDYDHRIPVPRERELATLVSDVNDLGGALASTEQRRLDLLGEVAHEMRTPLTVLDGYVEGMIDPGRREPQPTRGRGSTAPPSQRRPVGGLASRGGRPTPRARPARSGRPRRRRPRSAGAPGPGRRPDARRRRPRRGHRQPGRRPDGSGADEPGR